MSQLLIVRHGQAAFLSDDYDRLSDLGYRQAQRLGSFWQAEGLRIDEIYCGDLLRQRQTMQGVAEVWESAGSVWPGAQVVPELNEYQVDAFWDPLLEEVGERDALLRSQRDAWEQADGANERYRTFHRLLETVMRHYVADRYRGDGWERWPEFARRVRTAFETIWRRSAERGRNVVVFTSGGPIGVWTQTVLGAPERAAIDLHFRVYNTGVTCMRFNPERMSLDQFNCIPHLDAAELRTYR